MRKIIIIPILALAVAACGSAPVSTESSRDDTKTMEVDIKREYAAKAAEQDPTVKVDSLQCIDRKDSDNVLCYADLTRTSDNTSGQAKITVTVAEDGGYIWEADPVYFN